MWERYKERYKKDKLYRLELGFRMGVGKERIFERECTEKDKKSE